LSVSDEDLFAVDGPIAGRLVEPRSGPHRGWVRTADWLS
jgi:hypothetical protein